MSQTSEPDKLPGVVLTTTIPGLPLHTRGKVRDVYAVGPDALLLLATDRISAFDVIMNQGIPDKGRVLTQMSAWWFAQTAPIIASHLISANDEAIASRVSEVTGVDVSPETRQMLAGRALLCRKTRPLPIEAVVRGYLSGSGWKAYQTAPQNANGTIDLWGVPLPSGLKESDKLPAPVFTPSTKAEAGHDEPMEQNEIADYIGAWANPVQTAALSLYNFAADYAAKRGMILADTKFEFGIDGNQLILIDEALTPDSSRFWDAASYAPGRAQASWDKQFVRDYLETVPGWDKKPPAPNLPPDIIEKTAQKYRDAFRLLTGHNLEY